jgi:hypothetical protein
MDSAETRSVFIERTTFTGTPDHLIDASTKMKRSERFAEGSSENCQLHHHRTARCLSDLMGSDNRTQLFQFVFPTAKI